MPTTESPTLELHGMYHDVLTAPGGRVIWDRGWRSNTIVTTFRNLLATFVGGVSPSLGIQGLRVGQGVAAWDAAGPPAAAASQTALVDPNPYLAPRSALAINYLNGANVSATPTNRLQIVATLGPNMPTWPDANHVAANLREFGLVGTLNGAETLMNYVTHPVIVKDPASTLTRTIWLVF